eukprot:1122459-Amphidinium_carterae.1
MLGPLLVCSRMLPSKPHEIMSPPAHIALKACPPTASWLWPPVHNMGPDVVPDPLCSDEAAMPTGSLTPLQGLAVCTPLLRAS